MSNTFNVCRSIWTDPQFGKEPFTKREAWLWLVSEASWKDRQFRIGKYVFDLKRGQLAASTRGLAEVWQWTDSKVRRFLDMLRTWKNIDAVATHGATVITICNYERYQNQPNGHGGQTDALPTHYRRTTDAIQNKEEIPEENKASLSASPKPTKRKKAYPEDFETWWKEYPTDSGMAKQEACKAWEKLDSEDRAKALAAMPPFKAWIKRQFEGYRVVHAATFLNQRRFDGFAEQQSSEPQKPTRPVIQCNGAKYVDDVDAAVKRFFETGYWEPKYGYRPDNEWTDVPGWMIEKYGGVDPRQNIIQFQQDRKSGAA